MTGAPWVPEDDAALLAARDASQVGGKGRWTLVFDALQAAGKCKGRSKGALQGRYQVLKEKKEADEKGVVVWSASEDATLLATASEMKEKNKKVNLDGLVAKLGGNKTRFTVRERLTQLEQKKAREDKATQKADELAATIAAVTSSSRNTVASPSTSTTTSPVTDSFPSASQVSDLQSPPSPLLAPAFASALPASPTPPPRRVRYISSTLVPLSGPNAAPAAEAGPSQPVAIHGLLYVFPGAGRPRYVQRLHDVLPSSSLLFWSSSPS
ncbi:hypothetical protein JCM10207_000066 [Rhodosporidiobolus poonsookiae]